MAVSSSTGSTSLPETGTPAEGSTAGAAAHQLEEPPALSTDQPVAEEGGADRPGEPPSAEPAAAPSEPPADVERNSSLSKEPAAEADDMFQMDEVSASLDPESSPVTAWQLATPLQPVLPEASAGMSEGLPPASDLIQCTGFIDDASSECLV